MEISAQEAIELLKDPRNLANNPEFVKPSNGRTQGAVAVPESLRTIIAVAARTGGTIAGVAAQFGVSESTVAQAKKGNVGVNRHDPEFKEKVDQIVGEQKKELRELALDRLAGMFASVINDQNLGALKPREAVSAAKDIATIVDKLTPKQSNTNVAVFVHAPNVREEKDFGEVIVVEPKKEESPRE